jgi:hypothetical protein
MSITLLVLWHPLASSGVVLFDFHNFEKDKIRDTFLKNEKNIEVFRISHADYIKDKDKEIKKCINFLK